MTSDTEIIGQTFPTIIFTLSAPIQVAIVLYLLYRQIEWLCFVPIGVMFVIMPISGLLGAKMYYYFEASQKARDERIKAVNELTYAIRIVKFYTWEKAFEKKIAELRREELSLLRSVYMWATAMYGILLTAPDMSTAVTFILYGLFNQPEISVLFTSLNLLDQVIIFLPSPSTLHLSSFTLHSFTLPSSLPRPLLPSLHPISVSCTFIPVLPRPSPSPHHCLVKRMSNSQYSFVWRLSYSPRRLRISHNFW